MRRRLALLVAATTSLVLVAFLVPLGVLIRDMAADQAISSATTDAQNVAQIMVTVDRSTLTSTLDTLSANAGEDYPVTVFLADGSALGAPAKPSHAVQLAMERGSSITAEAPDGQEVVIAVGGLPGGTAAVRTYVSDAELHEGVTRAWLILGMLGIALLAIGLLVADRLGRSYVRDLGELDDTARRLGSGDLDARAEPHGPPELVAVGRTLNTMAERISELLAAERERVADLSHRIRTPLTVLRIDAEALTEPDDAERLSNDVAALERAVNQVIHDARSKGRAERSCEAGPVVAERVAFWQVLAEEEGRQLRGERPDLPMSVAVPRADLVACVDALLANVFAHTPEGTAFGVDLHQHPDGDVVLTVHDDGPGIDDVDNVLVRGESGGGSTGLGLDIVRRTAESAGGRVLIGRSVTGGAEISVWLPLSAARA